MNNISKRILEIREAKKIKQSEIANKLGIDRQNYSRLEKRGEKLTIEQLKQIADALGVEVEKLMDIDLVNDITSRIKKFRNSKGIGQAYMAEKMNIALLNYGKIERGVTELSVKRLYELANILEVSVNDLLYEPTQIDNTEKVADLERRILILESTCLKIIGKLIKE